MIKWIRSAFIITLTFCAFQVSSQNQTRAKREYSIQKNISFSASDSNLTLDLFIPEKSSKLIPCIIVIQGGGFKPQDGQRSRYIAEYIAEHKYAAALISYRGRPEHNYMTTIEDVKSAVRFIRNKSEEFGIDQDKLGATGRSAGATLAALLAVLDEDIIGDRKKGENVSSKVQAAVAYAGVFNFISRFTDSTHINLQPNIDNKIISNGEWIGTSFSANSKEWMEASAINHLDKDDSPILLMHCKDDKTVPWYQSQEMFEKMKETGIQSDTLFYENGGHGFKLETKEQALEPMLKYFKSIFL